MVQKHLRQKIREALEALGFGELDFAVAVTTDLAHGDYATNAVLKLAKQVGRPALAVAGELASRLRAIKPEFVERVEVAGPGFINFYLSRKFFAEELARILAAGEAYGRNQNLAGKRVMVEYTDPNPFKEFHVGHLMNNAIGEAISRLIEWQGAVVKRACYQGDVGLHVAKAIWAKGDYARGAKIYEEDAKARREIQELNKKIYDRSDVSLNERYEHGKAASLKAFERVYGRLGTKFDLYFFESESGPAGKKIVESNLAGVFEASEGASIFRGEKYGLHTRVFVTKDGLPTYEAKELGLAELKNERWPHDLSVVITGNEVNEYFKVALKAMEQMMPGLAGKIQHRSHGMMLGPDGKKMSSRTGQAIAAETLLDETVKLARGNEAVAVGAIKYAILKQAPGRNVVFDLKRALSLQGDSGPYLQYACVRIKSVLAKAGAEPPWRGGDAPEPPGAVLRLLPRFPEVVERAAADFSPHHLAIYLTELAGAFNAYYEKNRIIGEPETVYRLAFAAAVGRVLQNGLWLLGIGAPEKM